LNDDEESAYLEMSSNSIVRSFFRSSLEIHDNPSHMLLFDEDVNLILSVPFSLDLVQKPHAAWVVGEVLEGESLEVGEVREVGPFYRSSEVL
jgi:hypothetical protein